MRRVQVAKRALNVNVTLPAQMIQAIDQVAAASERTGINLSRSGAVRHLVALGLASRETRE